LQKLRPGAKGAAHAEQYINFRPSDKIALRKHDPIKTNGRAATQVPQF
jgi:hypothetical protein